MDDATQENQQAQPQLTNQSANNTATRPDDAQQERRQVKEPTAPAADLNKLDLSQLQGFSFGTKWESKPEERRDSRGGDYGGAARERGDGSRRDRRSFGDKRENRSGDSAPAQRDRRGFRKPQGSAAGGDFSAQRSESRRGEGGQQEPRNNSGAGDRRQAGGSFQGTRRGGSGGASGTGGRFFQQNRDVPPPPYESPYFAVSFYPEDTSFAALAKTIRSSYRTLELFEIARTVVAKNDRFIALLTRKPSADSEAPRQSIYIARPDGVPFDSEEAVINYVVSQHIGQFFQTDQVQVDPPKGNFQVINRCGVTGELLGPPNYHRYNQIVQQHFDARIKHLSFDAFRAKIETLRDEAVVAEWLEKMKTVTRYTWRGNAKKKTEPAAAPKSEATAAPETEAAAEVEKPSAPETLPTPEPVVSETIEVPQDAVESSDAELTSGTPNESPTEAVLPEGEAETTEPSTATFDSLEEAKVYLLTHARDKVYRTSDTVRFHGNLLEKLPEGEIRRAIEGALERQRRFPLDTANGLRGRLRREHFTIFKKGSKGISYVCAVKRKFRTPGQTFADSISALIDFIEKNPMVLVSELPERFLGIKTAPQPPAAAEVANESKDATGGESASTTTESVSEALATASASAESAKDAVAEREALHRLQLDLRWLVTEGYVTEFMDGRLFAAPPIPESRKQAAENADTPDLENFPEVSPPTAAPSAETSPIESGPATAAESTASDGAKMSAPPAEPLPEPESSAEPALSPSLPNSDTQATTP